MPPTRRNENLIARAADSIEPHKNYSEGFNLRENTDKMSVPHQQ